MTIVLFIITILIIFILIWQTDYAGPQTHKSFTQAEKAVLRRQVIALAPLFILLLSIIIFGIWFVVSTALSITFPDRFVITQITPTSVSIPKPIEILFSISIYSGLAYIGITSIKYRVSIIKIRGQRSITKGDIAVGYGALVLGWLLIHLVGQISTSGLLHPLQPCGWLDIPLKRSGCVEVIRTEGLLYSLTFSPDGTLLAAAGYNDVIELWHVKEKKVYRSINADTELVNEVAFSPDGSIIAAGLREGIVRGWRVSDKTPLFTLEGHTGPVEAVVFSPDGSIVVSGGDKTLRLWRVADGTLLHVLETPGALIRSIAFSPDGSTLAAGTYDKSIYLWTMENTKLLNVLIDPNANDLGVLNTANRVAFSPDGTKLAAGSEDGKVRIWRISDGMLLYTLNHNNGDDEVNDIAFSPDGSILASGSFDQTIKLWQVSNGSLLRTIEQKEQIIEGIQSLAFSPDEELLAVSSYSKIGLWEVSQ